MDKLKKAFGERKPKPVKALDAMALQLGVSQKWLKAEAEAGRIPCLKAGRTLLFNPEAVFEVLAERARSGDTGGGS